jgi:hypothetical protein
VQKGASGGGWENLCCVEGGEEQEEAKRHGENIGRITRQAHGALPFATLAITQLVIGIMHILPI